NLVALLGRANGRPVVQRFTRLGTLDGVEEPRNGEGRQNTDDDDHDRQFDEGETLATAGTQHGLHTNLLEERGAFLSVVKPTRCKPRGRPFQLLELRRFEWTRWCRLVNPNTRAIHR